MSIFLSHRAGAVTKVRRPRRFGIEPLEPRYALDGQLGAWLPRFGTNDAFREYLLADALARYDGLFGQRSGSTCWEVCYLGDQGGIAFGVPQRYDFFAATDGTSSSSATNVQVAGVDEGDILEVDDRFLYILSGNEVAIVAATPAEQPQVTSRIALEGTGVAEFLIGDRLTVISTDRFWGDPQPLVAALEGASLRRLPFAAYQATVTVTVYDVSDRAAPRQVEQTRLDGTYRDSRAVDDKVLVVVSNSQLVLPPPERLCDANVVPPDWPPAELPLIDERMLDRSFAGASLIWDPTPSASCVFETREAWLERITPQIDSLVIELLPHFTSYGPDGELARAGLLHEPADLVRPVSPATSQLLSLVTFDVDDGDAGVLAAEGIATGLAGQVYASRDMIVVWEPDWREYQSAGTRLLAYRWDPDTGAPRAAAVGVVPGLVINPFALDEHDGYLRVATTASGWFNAEGLWASRNYLTILRPHEGQLEMVGQLTDFGTSEQIRSVRFLGDVAFVVTFQQIDPLFTIDLKDPAQPRVVGELEMPGFSGYLQMLDDRHLIGLGYSTDGNNHWWPRLALFDVADLAQPTLVAEYLLPAGGQTLALTDHHALLWDPDAKLLALPITLTAEGPPVTTADGSVYPTWRQIGELLVLHIETAPVASPLPTIRRVAEIFHDEPVVRSARVGEHLYSVSQTDLKVVALADPSAVIGSLAIFPSPSPPAEIPGWAIDPWFLPWVPWPEDPSALPPPALTPSPTDDEPLREILALAVQDLAAHLKVTDDEIRLVTAESAQWLVGTPHFVPAPPGAGESMMGGFQLVLAAAGVRYLYRTDSGSKVELTEEQFVYARQPPESPWHRGDDPLDTTADGEVSPLDALVIINELNARGARELRSQYPMRAIARPDSANRVEYFWDVDGDRFLAPLDALRVINWLNEQTDVATRGEGEDPSDARSWRSTGGAIDETGRRDTASENRARTDGAPSASVLDAVFGTDERRDPAWLWCVAVDHVASEWL